MPELPEVEVIRRGVMPHVTGGRIDAVRSSGKRMRLPMPLARLRKNAVGRKILQVDRRAKYLLFGLDNGATLVIHLGMTGRLGLFSPDQAVARHDHLRLFLNSAMELRFNDARRFGSVQMFSDAGELEEFLAPLGPEPFSESYSADYLSAEASGKRQPVKNFLMDNRVVVGIGNIYACEILYAARLHPQTPVCLIGSKKWQTVVKKTQEILARAIEQGGTTIINFVQFSGKSGYFQNELEVYGRENEPCPCCGNSVRKINLAGRSTFYCGSCQR